MLLELAFLIFSLLLIQADRQFNCPNGGSPKVDEKSRKPLQCLPGQTSELVCGKGHSCFFSGFNYQCCPTAADDEEDFHGDCPLGSFAVIKSDGSLLKCNGNKHCPKAGMFCNLRNSPAICCEIFGQLQKPIPEVEVKQENKAKSIVPKKLPKHLHDLKTVVDVNTNADDCPDDSKPVLAYSGKVKVCEENGIGGCHEKDMFCYPLNDRSICCKRTPEIVAVDRSTAAGATRPGKDQLKKFIENVKKITEESRLRKALEKLDRREGQQHLSKVNDRESPALEKVVADNEATTTRPSPKTDAKSKAKAAKIVVPENDIDHDHPPSTDHEKDNPQLKPHSQGGYAKLQQINSRRPLDERKAMAQHYLLEQIKNGWPYDERFYRPDGFQN